MMGIRALVSWYTHKIEEKLKEKASLLFILFSQVIVYIIFSTAGFYALILAFAVLYGVIAFQEIVFEDYVNGHIESKIRATVLSVKSLIYNLVGAGLYVSIGKLIDIFSISYVLIGTALVIAIGSMILFMFKKGSVKNCNLA